MVRGEFTAIQAGFALLPALTAGTAIVVNGAGTALTNTVGTLALAGAFATTGAFSTTLAQSASVTLTLPAVSGTLATLAGTETLTNKTLNGSSNTITNVSLTTAVTGTLPVANGGTGITSLGSNVAAFLGTPSSANLAAAVTDETGSGALVFGTSPTLVTPALGTPASGVLTNCTTATAALGDSTTKLASTAFVQAALPVVQNYISGLQLSTSAGSTFGIAAGIAMDSGNVTLMALASALTKSTSAWAVGNNNGGLDTGAIANSTWYYVFLIERTDLSVVDVLVSLSQITPTMPSNYTLKRRIGAMKTDGSSHWTAFSQIGDHFIWSAGPSKDVDQAPSIAQAAVTVNVPPLLQVVARIRGFFQGSTSTETGFLVSSTAETTNTATPLSPGHNVTVLCPSDLAVNASLAFTVDVMTNSAAQVNIVASNSSGSNLVRMGAYGWIDTRGKN